MSPDLQSKMLAVFIVSLIVPGCAAIPLDSTFLPFSGLNVRKSQLNPNRRSLLQAYTYSTLTEAPNGSKTFNGVCSSQFACTTGSCSATSLTAYFDTTIPSYAVDSDPSTVFSTDDSEGLRYLRLAYSSPISVAGGVIYADNANRLYSFMIWVGNDPTYPGTNVKCYQSTTASYNNFAPIVETFSCGVTGKYVYVSDSLAADYFQINELYIYKYSNVSNQVVSSSGSQCVCPDGLSIVNGACSCSPGYFLSASTCQICPANSYCPSGSTSPTSCGSGSLSSQGSASISSCQSPQIYVNISIDGASSTMNQSQFQNALPSNVVLTQYQDVLVAVQASCFQGYYCPVDTTTPIPCPAGTYNSLPNIADPSGCLTCPQGSYCPSASMLPTSCAAGSYMIGIGASQQSNCVTCPSGNYCPLGTITPSNCSAGTYNPVLNGTGIASCLACPAGEYCPLATTTPSVCSAGSYRGSTGGAQQGDCTTCPTGNYCPASSVNPTNCSAGTYEPSTGGTDPTSCLTCPAGEYCPLATTTPSVCSAGSYRGSTGGAQQGDCTTCPTGNYCPASSVNPTNCSAGTYEPSTGGTAPASCLACPAGQYCPLATTTPSVCSAGSYRGSTGGAQQGDCTTCPTGNYCPANSVNPTNCSAGTYEPSTGGTAPASCLACPAGQYCPLATTTPSVCSAGSYRGTTGGTQQGDCTACPTGNYCPASSVNPINCSAGTYEPSTGGSAPSSCLSCPQADYCPVATTSPTQCSANTYSLGSASVCSSCPGYSTSAVASINCTCINGHYQSGSVTGGGSAGLSETMTGLDSYFTLSGYGASKLSFVTFNGYANITVLQGTVITMASALYGASHFSMNIYSNLASIATYTISMYSLDPSFQGMYTIDFVPYTNSISGCSSYLYTNGVTGSGTASLTWNTATVPPGMYYVMATTGGSGTIRNAGYILVATPSPATYNLPLALTTQPRWILVALGDTVVFTQSSGLTNIYIDSEPNSDSAGTISNREATGVFPFTWSTSSASVSSQYIVSTDNGAMLFYIIIVPRPTSTASPYLTCPNCSTGTYSLAGNTACTNCGYGNYSAAVSSSCTTCPVGTMCNSITTPTPVNCGLGNYQGSTGQSSCMTCPQNQYCASPTTSTPITCPTHTSSVAGSSSLLQCRCTQGFVCTYTKRITAVITLNSTLYNFNNDVGGVKTALINAVATAAGVTASKVTINSAAQKTGNRRLLELSGSHSFIDVHTVIEGAERLRGLDLHLAKHSATLHKDHSWQEAHTLSARPARPMLASR